MADNNNKPNVLDKRLEENRRLSARDRAGLLNSVLGEIESLNSKVIANARTEKNNSFFSFENTEEVTQRRENEEKHRQFYNNSVEETRREDQRRTEQQHFDDSTKFEEARLEDARKMEASRLEEIQRQEELRREEFKASEAKKAEESLSYEEITKENERRVAENAKYAVVGTGLGMSQASDTSSILDSTNRVAFVEEAFFKNSTQKELTRIEKVEESKRAEITKELERQREDLAKDVVSRNNVRTAREWDEASNAEVSSVDEARRAFVRSAGIIKRTEPGYSPNDSEEYTARKEKSVDMATADTREAVTGNRYREVAAREASQKALGGAVSLVKGQISDISESSSGEFSEGTGATGKVAKPYMTYAMTVMKAKIAQNNVIGGKLDKLDSALGNTNSEMAKQLAKCRTSVDFKDAEKAIGLQTMKNFNGIDVSTLSTRQLSKFAKEGAEQKAIVEAVLKLRKSEKIAPPSLNPEGLKRATAKAFKDAVIVSQMRGDFFDAGGSNIAGTAVGRFHGYAAISRRTFGAIARKAQDGIARGITADRVGQKVFKSKLTRNGVVRKETKLGKIGRKINQAQGKALSRYAEARANQAAATKAGKTILKQAGERSAKKTAGMSAVRNLRTKLGGKVAGSKFMTKLATPGVNNPVTGKVMTKAGAKLTRKFLGTKLGASVAKRAAGKGAAAVASKALMNVIGSASGGIGYLVEFIITIVIILSCFCCSVGVNDLFTSGTPFSLDHKNKTVQNPNDSYAAETMVLLDAYLSRNYEYICRRGIEHIVKENFNNKTDDGLMSITKAKSAGYEWFPISILKDDSGNTVHLKYDIGRVSVIAHQDTEKFKTDGTNMSTPKRYYIDSINGISANLDDKYSSTTGLTESSDMLRTLVYNGNLVERYVYDVESINSVFYTDYNHTIVPNVKNFCNFENIILGDGVDNYGDSNGNEIRSRRIIEIGSDKIIGEATPFDNTVFDNTKEIISMAIAAFSNEFLYDENVKVNNAKGVTPGQFQGYCYALWLRSHYVTSDAIEKGKNGAESAWANFFSTDNKKPLADILKANYGEYRLDGIHDFGGISQAMFNSNKPNIIIPLKTSLYSPEVFHYGVYSLESDGILKRADNFEKFGNHIPISISVTDVTNSVTIPDQTVVTSQFYNLGSANQPVVVAAKLPIVNFDSVVSRTENVGLTLGSRNLLNDLATTTTTNFRNFSDNDTLVKDSGNTGSNANSFVYTKQIQVPIGSYTTNPVPGESVTDLNKNPHKDAEDDTGLSILDDPDAIAVASEQTSDVGWGNMFGDQTMSKPKNKWSKVVDYFDHGMRDINKIEDAWQELFWKTFGTNLGYDKEDGKYYTYNTYVDSSNSDKTVETSNTKLNSNMFLTDCGTQEAYAGSVLLSKNYKINGVDKSDKYVTKGNRDILMNVLSSVVDANPRDPVTDEPLFGGLNATDVGNLYYGSQGYIVDGAPAGVSVNTALNATTYNIPVVFVNTSDPNYDENTFKEWVKTKRCVVIKISTLIKPHLVTYHWDEPMTEDEIAQREAENPTPEGVTPLNTVPKDEKVAVARYTVDAFFNIPVAEYCGFYLCGGHTQIALMPVILTMTGEKNLFNVEFDEDLLTSVGISGRNSFIGQNLEGLNKMWDTGINAQPEPFVPSSSTLTAEELAAEKATWEEKNKQTQGEYALARQNIINALNALSDSWESRYGINYSNLKMKSDEIVDEILADSANDGLFNPNSHSNLKATKAYVEDAPLWNKYMTTGFSADPYASIMSGEDLATVTDMVSKELTDKGILETEVPADGKIQNEYENRLNRISRALSKVGRIAYSQTNHRWSTATPIKNFNDLIYKTDCSGYVSWILGYGVSAGHVKNPDGTYTYADPEHDFFTTGGRDEFNEMYSPIEDNDITKLVPGDVIFIKGHVMLYVCYDEVNDKIYYCDCNSWGGKLGPGGVEFRGDDKDGLVARIIELRSVPFDVYPETLNNN